MGVSYNDRIQLLLSAVDRIIEDREHVNRIEREVGKGEECHIVYIFAVNTGKPITAELMGEIDKVTIAARDAALTLEFDAGRIRTAKDRRACRQFDIE